MFSMSFITSKSRYKEYGLVVHYEYEEAFRTSDDLPKKEVLTTLRRPTSYVSSLRLLRHTVKEGETVHRLALRYYGDAKLWWFIADYNPLVDINNLESGSSLVIPPNTEVNAY